MRPTASSPEVARRMRGIRRTGTAPEIAVAAILRELHVRYRTNVKTLPGSPDFANKTRHWAIFVHGCFWHGHDGCRLYRLPKTNPEFWKAKVDANRRRDATKALALERLGFRVIIVWQCELSDLPRLRARFRRLSHA